MNKHLLVIAMLAAAAPALGAAPKKAASLDTEQERIAAAVLGSYRTGLSKERVRVAAETLVAVSEKNGVDPYLVLGVIRVESSGWNQAHSSVGARGLMQVMPFVGKALAKETGVKWNGADSLHDPEVNLALGVHYLATLVKRYDGNVDKALAAYSMGPSKMDGILGRGKKPVDDYEITVKWFADRYRALAEEHGAVEPGLSRFEVALGTLEKQVGGKPKQAYVLATGKQPPKAKKKAKPAVAVSAAAARTPLEMPTLVATNP